MLNGLWRQLGRKAPDRAPEAKASRTAGLLALHLTGRPVWTPRNFEALAREGYRKNPVVYRCVRMIAEAAACAPWVLYEGAREIEEHPLLRLLDHPNPAQGGVELFEHFFASLQMAGNAYLELAGTDGASGELYSLRPDRVQVVPGAEGWPEAYDYAVAGQSVRLRADGQGRLPVMHMRLFDPVNDHYGMSPLEAAAMAVDVHNEGAAWNKALLDNAARPSGALVYKGPEGSANLSDEQFERLKAELEENYQGARNAGRPLLLEGGLSWAQMALSPSDMDFIEARHVAAREIALAFGVPPMLLGIPGDNTYANYREANLAFWRQTVLPLLQKTAASLSTWLGPRFGPELRLGIDTDRMDGLTSEREALWARVGSADFLDRDEKREAVGYGALGRDGGP